MKEKAEGRSGEGRGGVRVQKTTKLRAKGNAGLQQFSPSNIFLSGTSLTPMRFLLLFLGLGLCLRLVLRKPPSPELQGLCSYKRHAKGNTRHP